MKALRICVALFAGALMAHASFAADGDDRPAGVAAKDWLPISDRFGFVVIDAKAGPIVVGSRQVLLADPERVSADLMPPKKGYFAIKTKTGWQRVVVSELSEVGG